VGEALALDPFVNELPAKKTANSGQKTNFTNRDWLRSRLLVHDLIVDVNLQFYILVEAGIPPDCWTCGGGGVANILVAGLSRPPSAPPLFLHRLGACISVP
jgi:hypothetical protein